MVRLLSFFMYYVKLIFHFLLCIFFEIVLIGTLFAFDIANPIISGWIRTVGRPNRDF